MACVCFGWPGTRALQLTNIIPDLHKMLLSHTSCVSVKRQLKVVQNLIINPQNTRENCARGFNIETWIAHVLSVINTFLPDSEVNGKQAVHIPPSGIQCLHQRQLITEPLPQL